MRLVLIIPGWNSGTKGQIYLYKEWGLPWSSLVEILTPRVRFTCTRNEACHDHPWLKFWHQGSDLPIHGMRLALIIPGCNSDTKGQIYLDTEWGLPWSSLVEILTPRVRFTCTRNEACLDHPWLKFWHQGSDLPVQGMRLVLIIPGWNSDTKGPIYLYKEWGLPWSSLVEILTPRVRFTCTRNEACLYHPWLKFWPQGSDLPVHGMRLACIIPGWNSDTKCQIYLYKEWGLPWSSLVEILTPRVRFTCTWNEACLDYPWLKFWHQRSDLPVQGMRLAFIIPGWNSDTKGQIYLYKEWGLSHPWLKFWH